MTSKKTIGVSPLTTLLGQCVQQGDQVLQEWIDIVVPNLLVELSSVDAKGMGGRAVQKLLEAKQDQSSEASRQKAVATWANMPDQSMAVHILNGAFGGWVVVQLAGLTTGEQRLYLAGFTMHDLNKMACQDVRLDGVGREAYLAAVEEWAERLNLWTFIDPVYREDVAFLAHNAERKRGENRTLANYAGLKTDPAVLEDLSDFVRLADLLSTLAFHPEDLSTGKKSEQVQHIIRRVLNGCFRLAYHKTLENRGLLTQVIHNQVLQAAAKVGWKPWLFFPDGVTYIVPREAGNPDVSSVPTQVRADLVKKVSRGTGDLVSRGPHGIKFKPALIELLEPLRAGEQVVERVFEIINDKKLPVTEERKKKTTLRPGVSVDLDFNYEQSNNADRYAEGMRAL
ncbi:MAG: type I-D CRISPR-associated protein Cas10d/Csc3, partial [Heliobacteriaceae bacterium]|nr:type I-D CRISPR-associated protein Cas10d/Csc3 [Heliobacteriaceae bacterium]